MAPEVKDPVQERIIQCICNQYSITEDQLKNGTTFYFVYLRWIVFYLSKNHTILSDKQIGNRLKKQRNAVRNGIETIEVRLKIKYGQTVNEVKTIRELAGISDD
jgi:chromosomal replication initiation ATPase DnaA